MTRTSIAPIKAAITAVGSYVPEEVLTNQDLEQWSIPTMSGFKQEQGYVKEE